MIGRSSKSWMSMNKSFLFFTSFLLLILNAVPGVASVDQKASTFVLCKSQQNIRSIRILPESSTPDGCMITYSKGDSEEVVGSHRSMSNCKSILRNIQANLEESKWSCKTYLRSAVTTSSEVKIQ
jgi:hypothetical protein